MDIPREALWSAATPLPLKVKPILLCHGVVPLAERRRGGLLNRTTGSCE